MISLKASEHPVKSVTIFQSSTAELTRTFVVNLQAGRNTVEISGISSQVDKESPRIHGLGSAARVFDISCTLRTSPKYRVTKNLALIKEVTTKRNALLLERNLRQEEYDMLNNSSLGTALTTEASAQIDPFVDNIIWRKREAMKAVQGYDQQIEEIDDELWTLQNTHQGETAARVVATILAKRDCEVEFQLTYLVTGVKWQPHYDLHASTADGKPSSDVVLLYCANISQSTGEDWNDTVLTLSTANSQALKSLSVPKIDPLKVSPAQEPKPLSVPPHPPRPAPMAAAPIRMARMTMRASTSHASQQWQEPESFSVIEHEDAEPEQPSTSVDRSPLSLAYRVEGTVSLPSDGIAHKVSVAMLEFSAELKYVCVPRKTTSAFIEGTVKNTSEYELLAGPVSVFMDDGFVTKTSLSLIGVNESFNCVLGVDTALKVSYNQRSVTSQEPPRSFAEPTKTTTRTITATVTNGHQFDISALIVRDGIPLGDADANIKVMLRKPDGLAQAKDGEEVPIDLGADVQDAKVRWSKVEKGQGGEKDGMYEWVCGTVVAGKEVKFEAEWDIKSPANVRWEEKPNAQ
ncbi:hypothetical protein C8Q76DRAFT_749605 [Earliella scabrosa]|nr:hypothetical protein C8Q76DRAFT_749605 [Earliella scabrosa]